MASEGINRHIGTEESNMLNMQERSSNDMPEPVHRSASPRYLSSDEIDVMLKLLIELRDTTLSYASHTTATQLIAELGGLERFGLYEPAQCAMPSPQSN